MSDGSTGKNLAALTNGAALVFGLPGRLDYLCGVNTHTAVVYIQVFDAATAGAVTVGTTPPIASIPLPPNSAPYFYPVNLKVTKGIVLACTAAPTGAGAPGQTQNLVAGFRS